MKIGRGFLSFLLLLAVSFTGARRAQAADKPEIDEIVTVIFEFRLTADGKAQNIQVVKCMHPRDRSDAGEVLTDFEKRAGVRIMAARPYHPRPDQVGIKRYDFLLFDTKTRRFVKGTEDSGKTKKTGAED